MLRKMVAEEQMQKLAGRAGLTDRPYSNQAVKELRVLSLLLAFVLSLGKAMGGKKKKKCRYL